MIFTVGAAPGGVLADVAIVGAGPAGICLSLTLARAGIRSVVLESGGKTEDPWTAALSMAKSVIPPEHANMGDALHRRLGGASWVWGGRCVDFDPYDFERPQVGEAKGWPISHGQAVAEAGAAGEFLGIGGGDFTTNEDWLGAELMTRLERWCADPQLARAHAAEIRRSEHAHFYLGLTCTGIVLDPFGRRVTGLRIQGRSGLVTQVAARHYIVAAGGLESARLLLSSDDVSPGGIGAASGWLGAGYMGHLQGSIADIAMLEMREGDVDYVRDGQECYVRPRLVLPPESLRKHDLLNIAFLVENPPLGDWRHQSAVLSALALALQTPGLGRRLQSSPVREILLGPMSSGRGFDKHLLNMLSDPGGILRFAADFVPRRLSRPVAPGMLVRNRRRRYSLKYYAEQSPTKASRVALSGDLDALGVRRLIINEHIAPADAASVLRAHEVLDAALRRRGLAQLSFHDDESARRGQVLSDGADRYHQIGLARMSRDPADGVVDCNCRVHGIANLHVAGSAIFPTSSQANPTFMVICLAIRLAKQVAAAVTTSADP